MTDEPELQAKFWKALKSDMTVMLGLAGVDEGHTRPMTAQLDGERAFGSQDVASHSLTPIVAISAPTQSQLLHDRSSSRTSRTSRSKCVL